LEHIDFPLPHMNKLGFKMPSGAVALTTINAALGGTSGVAGERRRGCASPRRTRIVAAACSFKF
jgi:hypothetical protein